MNRYTADGLRICEYRTMRGWAGFVEDDFDEEGCLHGFTSAPDPFTNALQLARIVAKVRASC